MTRSLAAGLLLVALEASAQERSNRGGGPGGGPGEPPMRGGEPGQPPRRAMGTPMTRPRNMGPQGGGQQGGPQGGPQGGGQQGPQRPPPDPILDRAIGELNLARGAARGGHCDQALPRLLHNLDSPAFSADAAVWAAICTERLGWLDDALNLATVAVELDPYHIRAATVLALGLDTWGDRIGALEQLDRIEGMADTPDADVYGRAVLAIRDGDFDAFDLIAREWPSGPKAALELRRLQARTWLDLDDPISAFNAVAEQAKGEGWEDVAIRGEAARRLGNTVQAMEMLSQERLEESYPPVIDAIRARVLVDDRKLDDARRVLAPYLGLPDEEVIASQWYIARSTGAATDAATLAHDFERLKQGHARRLEFLIPLTVRPPDAPTPEPIPPVGSTTEDQR